MFTTINRIVKEAEKRKLFLRFVTLLYRSLRLVCCKLEDRFPGISEDAKFKVSIHWTEDLGFDREANEWE